MTLTDMFTTMAKKARPDDTDSVGVAWGPAYQWPTDFTFSEDGDEIRGDQLEEEYDCQNGVFGYDDQFDDITPKRKN